eukprot:m.300927 g.300927  ORF g.300927 m.300927 type:complete len:81 (-) comp15876_c0_seq12:52-294(-)
MLVHMVNIWSFAITCGFFDMWLAFQHTRSNPQHLKLLTASLHYAVQTLTNCLIFYSMLVVLFCTVDTQSLQLSSPTAQSS